MKLAIMSIYMDTRSCKSTKFIESDREFIIDVAKKFSFEEELDTFERLGYCLTDLSRPIEELAYTDWKEYDFEGKKISVSHLQTVRNNTTDRIVEAIRSHICEKLKEKKIYLWILMVSDPKAETTDVIRIGENSTENKRYNKLLSRSTDVIPALEAEFDRQFTEKC
jgi:inorganic pyrophosphatase/exopolyphosphatase